MPEVSPHFRSTAGGRHIFPVREHYRGDPWAVMAEAMAKLPTRSSGRFLEAAVEYLSNAPNRKELMLRMQSYAEDPRKVAPWGPYHGFTAEKGNDPKCDGTSNPDDLHVVYNGAHPQIRDDHTLLLVVMTLIWVEHSKHNGASCPHPNKGMAPLRYIDDRLNGRTPAEAYGLRSRAAYGRG